MNMKKKKNKLTPSQELWNTKLEQVYMEDKNIKEEFESLKKEFFKVDTDETLKKWKILSKAYELGKQINKGNYSVLKLSEDFEIPYTTTKRILSLNNATEKTWDMIKQGKISSFRVAQICMTKNKKYQDKVVDLVIKDKLSTTQVKKLRIDNRGDIKQARLKAALEKGFARKSTAYKSLEETLNRVNNLLSIKKEDLPESKINEMITLLITTQNNIALKIIEFKKGSNYDNYENK